MKGSGAVHINNNKQKESLNFVVCIFTTSTTLRFHYLIRQETELCWNMLAQENGPRNDVIALRNATTCSVEVAAITS
jgi:hypothetical protein